MLSVHHLENSQSIRVVWLLEELGVEYRLKTYKRCGPHDLAPEDYKQLHPLGTSPTISDGDLVLAETNAIIDYILDKYPESSLRPKASATDRADYLFWLHSAQGTLTPLLIDLLIFKRVITGVPFFIRPIAKMIAGQVKASFIEPRLYRILGYMEKTLEKRTWLAGNQFTAADIVMGYCLEVAEVRVGFENRFPHIADFLTRIRERPAYKVAISKTGKFTPLLD
ncbi:glutathione S-transferase family protein [Sneathiella aquimaris]|uniref:glutathione S-transferase family protein n=1 Tax=Sneathiella aquimaris TaxID=2599305 RepID=UPI00146AF6ED|nr:glutathione S-transferase [Sneathiella aquimaris]